MSISLHVRTPRLGVIDPRVRAVRSVAYARRLVLGNAEAIVDRLSHDTAGRITRSWSPRSFDEARLGPGVSPDSITLYSLSGRSLRDISVDAGSQVRLFGAAGELTSHWNARGGSTHSFYDGRLRPTRIHETADGKTRCVERMDYADAGDSTENRRGHIIRHDDPAGCREVGRYDLNGFAVATSRRFLVSTDSPNWSEPTEERDVLLESDSHVTRRKHDAVGAWIEQVDARGNRQQLSYNVSGELAAVRVVPSDGSGCQVVLSGRLFDAGRQLLGEVLGNGVTSTLCYDDTDGRLSHMRRMHADGHAVQDLSYEYDPVGNVVVIDDRLITPTYHRNARVSGRHEYIYDSLDRLVEATGCEAVGSLPFDPDNRSCGLPQGMYRQYYRYDANGNMVDAVHVGARRHTLRLHVAPRGNRALPYSKDGSVPDLDAGFDAHGNMLERLPGQPLTWNARDGLREATYIQRDDGHDDKQTYVYDSSGQRLRKVSVRWASSEPRTTDTRYLPGLQYRLDGTGMESIQVMMVQPGSVDILLARARLADTKEGGGLVVRYVIVDHLGSAVNELDANGLSVFSAGYYPYGGTAWWRESENRDATDRVFGHAGGERDATGLVYHGHRYYAPWLARWAQPDPSGDTDGQNRYVMVGCNPVTFVDPDGRRRTPAQQAQWQRNLHGTMAWRDSEPSWEIGHAVKVMREGMFPSPLFEEPASDVFGRWDVISMSALDPGGAVLTRTRNVIRRQEVPSATHDIDGVVSKEVYSRPRTIGEMFFVIDVPAANLIGAFGRDAWFPNHAGIDRPLDTGLSGSRLRVARAARNGALAQAVIHGHSKRQDVTMPNGTYLDVNTPVEVEAEKVRRDAGYSELLVVGKPGVTIHDGLGPSGALTLREIAVIPDGWTKWIAAENRDTKRVEWMPVLTGNLRRDYLRVRAANSDEKGRPLVPFTFRM